MSYSKRFLIFLLSVLLIVAQPVAYAASPVGWSASPADIIMNGATATITAIKGTGSSALQSTIKHAPTVSNVGKKILKGGGAGAVLMAVSQILGKAVDYVLDPANNRIKYTDDTAEAGGSTSPYLWWAVRIGLSTTFPSHALAASQSCIHVGGGAATFKEQVDDQVVTYKCAGLSGPISIAEIRRTANPNYDPNVKPEEKYIPISTVAAKVISNAASGEPQSQELLKTVALEDLESGSLDVPLNTNAVPKADAPPVVDPNAPPVDPTAPAPPFDPSSIIAAIKSVMAAVVNMSGVLGAKIDALMVDLGLKQAETIEAITAGTGEIVAANDRTGAKVAEMVAAIEAIEGNTLTGEVINDAIDRVIANDNVKVGDIIAAIEGIEGNTLDGQLINDAIDRVISNDDAIAQSAAEAAEAAEAARTTNDDTNTTAVTDAIEAAEAARAADAQEAKEAADAKAAADAAALEWAKEAPEAPTDTGVVVDEPISDFDSDKSYITFTGSCPPKYTASLSIMGSTAPFEFDYTPICTVMSYLKPFIVGAGYIAAAYIIAGHSRGSKD